MLLRRQMLVMEEQHQPVVKRALDLREGRVVDRPGKVHAVDVGAQSAGHRPDLDAGVDRIHDPTIGDGSAAAEGRFTGHCRLQASADFLAVGAYPPARIPTFAVERRPRG